MKVNKEQLAKLKESTTLPEYDKAALESQYDVEYCSRAPICEKMRLDFMSLDKEIKRIKDFMKPTS